MIIGKDSVLHNLPLELEQRQLFLLEGVRYSANAASMSYKALYDEIALLSDNKISDTSYYTIFKEAWNQIDWTARLAKLSSELGAEEVDEADIGENTKYMRQARPFRNTFQHLDERIDEKIIEMNAPVWGYLTWIKVVNPTTIKSFSIGSGHIREKYPINLNMVEAGESLAEPIDKITLQSIQNTADPRITINLSELHQRMGNNVRNIEKQIEDQSKEFTSVGSVSSELMMSLDFEFKNS